MNRTFFVDSENVGDLWVYLLPDSDEKEEILVFYTNRSPHMSYDNLRLLKECEKKVTFIKVSGGNNALDFQLVTELGYRLHGNPDDELIIVTNDTGFDAVVRYWKAKGKMVRRITGYDCKNFVRGAIEIPPVEALPKADEPDKDSYAESKQIEAPENHKQIQAPEKHKQIAGPEKVKQIEGAKVKLIDKKKASASGKAIKLGKIEDKSEPIILGKMDDEDTEKSEALEITEVLKNSTPFVDEEAELVGLPENMKSDVYSSVKKEPVIPKGEKDYAMELLYCIGIDHLPEWHNALVQIFGDKEGKKIYADIKAENFNEAYLAKHKKLNQKQKFELYCSIIFSNNTMIEKEPEGFSDYLFSITDKRKNLNSLRADLQSKYGKENGLKYYSVVKLHIKTLNKL